VVVTIRELRWLLSLADEELAWVRRELDSIIVEELDIPLETTIKVPEMVAFAILVVDIIS